MNQGRRTPGRVALSFHGEDEEDGGLCEEELEGGSIWNVIN